MAAGADAKTAMIGSGVGVQKAITSWVSGRWLLPLAAVSSLCGWVLAPNLTYSHVA